VHILTSRDGIDLGARGGWPAGKYLVEDMAGATYIQVGHRGATTMNYLDGNPRPFDEKEDWNGKKILIIRPGGFGDLLFCTPSIHEIKRRWPTAEVHVCVYSMFQDILFANPEVDKIVSYPISLDDAEEYHAWIFLENVIEGNPEAEKLHAVDVVAKRIGLTHLDEKAMRYELTEEEKLWALDKFPRTNAKRIAIQVEASGRARTYPGNLMTEVIIRLAQKSREVYLLGTPYKVKTRSTPLVRNLMIENLSFRQSVAAMTACDVVLGPDSVMDAVGMEAHADSAMYYMDRAKQAVMLETDRPIVLREAIMACRKGGTVSVPGVYGGFIDKVPMGAFMNKGLTMKTGQTHMMRYMKPLLDRIQNGEIDPSFVISHRVPIDQAPDMYKTFRDKRGHCTKVVRDPWANGAAA